MSAPPGSWDRIYNPDSGNIPVEEDWYVFGPSGRNSFEGTQTTSGGQYHYDAAWYVDNFEFLAFYDFSVPTAPWRSMTMSLTIDHTVGSEVGYDIDDMKPAWRVSLTTPNGVADYAASTVIMGWSTSHSAYVVTDSFGGDPYVIGNDPFTTHTITLITDNNATYRFIYDGVEIGTGVPSNTGGSIEHVAEIQLGGGEYTGPLLTTTPGTITYNVDYWALSYDGDESLAPRRDEWVVGNVMWQAGS